MLLAEIAAASADVAATSSRLAKVARLTETLRDAAPEEVAIAVAYLSGELPQGTVGVGWAALKERPEPAAEPTLERARGRRGDDAASRASPARARRPRGSGELEALFERATEPEQRLLVGLFLGELRQGALEGVMADAVAKAAGVPIADVRRAAMLAGDLAAVAEVAIREGAEGSRASASCRSSRSARCSRRRRATSRPGSSASTTPYVEWKLDGARIQAHRVGDEVAVVHAQPRRHHGARAGDRRGRPRPSTRARSSSTARRSRSGPTAAPSRSRSR